MLEKEAAGREEHTIAAGLEAAGHRGRADRLEIEVERLRAQNGVLEMQNNNLLAWREHHHMRLSAPPEGAGAVGAVSKQAQQRDAQAAFTIGGGRQPLLALHNASNERQVSAPEEERACRAGGAMSSVRELKGGQGGADENCPSEWTAPPLPGRGAGRRLPLDSGPLPPRGRAVVPMIPAAVSLDQIIADLSGSNR